VRGQKLHGIICTNQPQDGLHMKWEPPPSGIIHNGWFGNLVLHAMNFKLARSSSDHISDPFTFSTVGECAKESLGARKTDVWEDAEARQTVGKAARDPVRISQVEGGYPPFAEPDQKDGSQQDCKKQDDARGKGFPPQL
jgi:hypothetical protein